MVRITFDIDDRYSSVLSVTCIGQSGGCTNVHTHCFDISQKDRHFAQVESEEINAYGKPEMIFKEVAK